MVTALVAEAIGLPFYNYEELERSKLLRDPKLPDFKADKEARHGGEAAGEKKEEDGQTEFKWTLAPVPNVGPFVPPTAMLKIQELIEAAGAKMMNVKLEPTSERRILKEVLGYRFRQLLDRRERQMNRPVKQFLFEPAVRTASNLSRPELAQFSTQKERWGAALPGSEAIKRLHIEGRTNGYTTTIGQMRCLNDCLNDCLIIIFYAGPIPNMDPKKKPKKIRKLLDINPALPKIQPKDLEALLN